MFIASRLGPLFGPRAGSCGLPRMIVICREGLYRARNTRMPYYVYLLASRRHGTLYLGVTKDLVRRVHQHKAQVTPGFTAKYAVNRLVWFEACDDPATAITREKAIKKWRGLENPIDRGAEPRMGRPGCGARR
ncbi:MAG TPA: GIY-YIG nuclease family protein [Stellaceae bacterium]|nr:GIY-YIG nuclease family protein [Stellaceae bacterium]